MSMAIEHEVPRREDDERESKREVGEFRADPGRDSSEFETVELEGQVYPVPEAPRALVVAPVRANHEPRNGAVPRRVLMPGPPMLFHSAISTAEPPGGNGFLSYHDAMQGYQRFFISEALERNGWNVARTARMIKIQRSHLYKIIKAHQLVRPKKRRPGCGE